MPGALKLVAGPSTPMLQALGSGKGGWYLKGSGDSGVGDGCLADTFPSYPRPGLHSGPECASHQQHGQQPDHPAASPVLPVATPLLPAASHATRAEPRSPEPLHGHHGPAAEPPR